MKKFLTLVVCLLAVFLCTSCDRSDNSALSEDAYLGRCTANFVGSSESPCTYKMYSSAEYAFDNPIKGIGDHKDDEVEINMYLGNTVDTKYLTVGDSELFSLTDNGKTAYIYIEAEQRWNYRIWGVN